MREKCRRALTPLVLEELKRLVYRRGEASSLVRWSSAAVGGFGCREARAKAEGRKFRSCQEAPARIFPARRSAGEWIRTRMSRDLRR